MENYPFEDDPNIIIQLTDISFIKSVDDFHLDSININFGHIRDHAQTLKLIYEHFLTTSISFHHRLIFSHQTNEIFTARMKLS